MLLENETDHTCAYRYQNSPWYERVPYKLKVIQTWTLFSHYFKVLLKGNLICWKR